MINIFTKANSLKLIDDHNKKLVPQFLFFNKFNYLKDNKKYINKINKTFKSDIIIRSSAINEDNKKQSNAGHYESFIIKKKNFNEIEKKIIEIIRKFKNKRDQILVQNFIKKPDIAGVIFTKDKTTNSHYYDINYDTSKKSNLITSGQFNPTIKSLIIFKSQNISQSNLEDY